MALQLGKRMTSDHHIIMREKEKDRKKLSGMMMLRTLQLSEKMRPCNLYHCHIRETTRNRLPRYLKLLKLYVVRTILLSVEYVCSAVAGAIEA